MADASIRWQSDKCRAEPQQRTERRYQNRQGDHHRNDHGRDVQFDDHHAVQRPEQHDSRHPDTDLEQLRRRSCLTADPRTLRP